MRVRTEWRFVASQLAFVAGFALLWAGWLRASEALAAESSSAVLPTAVGDDLILGASEEPGWSLESFRARTSFYAQRGQGYQSQAGPIAGPGSEDAWILQPAIGARVRQSRNVRHDVYVAVDIVTAASPDAVDLVSRASRVNEAATFDVQSTLEVDADNEYSLRYGLHNEEHYRSFQLGAAFLTELAEDNASVLFSVNMSFDNFDLLSTRGRDPGSASRDALNFNLGFSQILSPTTLFDASGGLTAQLGTLETTWNSVPALKPAGREGGPFRRVAEELPAARYRGALGVRLAQHLPVSRTTVKGSYRLYGDTFGLIGNTAEVAVYQYLADPFYVRGSFRTHHQTGADMYTELAPANVDDRKEGVDRTADSDLAPFAARELGAKLLLYVSGGPADPTDDHAIDVAYYHYFRSNGLRVNLVSVGYAGQF